VWVTILKQIDPLLGLNIDGQAQRFLPRLLEIVQALPQMHLMTAILGIASIVALLVITKLAPRAPSAFIVLVVSILVVSVFGLSSQGVAVLGETGGSVTWPVIPTGVSLGQLVDLLPGALAVVVLSSTLGIAAAKRAAEKTGERIDPDREFLALGAANLGSGLSGGYPVTGTLSKTAVAMQAGGKSQVGNLFNAILAVLTILFLIPVFASLSDAALAAVVVVVMLEISNIGYFVSLWKVRRLECAIGVAAFAGVLAYGTLIGVAIGVVLALIALADHIRRPPTAVIGRTESGAFLPLEGHGDAHEIPGMLIWRQYAPLVFLNARRLSNELNALAQGRSDVRVVVVDGSATSGVDSTAGTAFRTARDDLAAHGIALWVANLRDGAWERIVANLTNIGAPIPPRFDSLADAVREFERSGANVEPSAGS
jgi:MFS superfamily sulfate permease-like transporter